MNVFNETELTEEDYRVIEATAKLVNIAPQMLRNIALSVKRRLGKLTSDALYEEYTA